MNTSARTLRLIAQATCPEAFALTPKQAAREAFILNSTEAILAKVEPAELGMRELCKALRLSKAAMEFHFLDINHLLSAVIAQFFAPLLESLATLPSQGEEAEAIAQQLYAEHVATPQGDTLRMMHILAACISFFPPDLLEELESWHKPLIDRLGGPKKFAFLSNAYLSEEDIEAAAELAETSWPDFMKTILQTTQTEPEPEPEAETETETETEITPEPTPSNTKFAAKKETWPAPEKDPDTAEALTMWGEIYSSIGKKPWRPTPAARAEIPAAPS